ncbi:MFS transporter [Halosquirtibacter laminarini]|uniref:MFS transporter n=1 Tax=Halosquirtibacter laminarini TaxID=3374600 RepID=A0AC61NMK5_9BACT|nr:MFS transporter [Prolixibacteraceae bacterium]
MSITKVFSKFPRTFWVANTIELFERWAWYGFFALFANYLTGSSDQGGLELTQTDKGYIMGVGTAILYFLPVITGAIADRLGYRKTLFISFIVYITAFLLFPHVDSFYGVFMVYLYLALGAALFKPVISATVAKVSTKETSSIAFGIFYMMVNIGAFIGPLLTLTTKSEPNNIFYISAFIISLNFILLYFFHEPKTEDKGPKGTIGQSIIHIFKNIGEVVKDYKFVAFLLIVAGFWTMYNQLFFTLPVFITQWVDTTPLYHWFSEHIPAISSMYGEAETQTMQAEFIVNSDALFIILFQIVISSIVMKWKALNAMMSGFVVCATGMALSLYTQNVYFTIFAIFIFAVGEMSSSPKISEYIGMIAPSDKKALYMGYSFIPVFLGNLFAGFIAGDLYGKWSDKAAIVKDFAQEKGFAISNELSQNEYFHSVAQKMNMSDHQLTDLLWNQYNPSKIWVLIYAVGIFSVVALFLYNRFILNKK